MSGILCNKTLEIPVEGEQGYHWWMKTHIFGFGSGTES